MSMIDNPNFQKKLCITLRHICIYFTFFIAIFILAQIWGSIIESEIFWKILGTYAVTLFGSVIVWRIFVESDKK